MTVFVQRNVSRNHQQLIEVHEYLNERGEDVLRYVRAIILFMEAGRVQFWADCLYDMDSPVCAWVMVKIAEDLSQILRRPVEVAQGSLPFTCVFDVKY